MVLKRGKERINSTLPGEKSPHKALTSRRRLPASRSRGASLRGRPRNLQFFPLLVYLYFTNGKKDKTSKNKKKKKTRFSPPPKNS